MVGSVFVMQVEMVVVVYCITISSTIRDNAYNSVVETKCFTCLASCHRSSGKDEINAAQVMQIGTTDRAKCRERTHQYISSALR